MASMSDDGPSRKRAGPTKRCSAGAPIILQLVTPPSPTTIGADPRSIASEPAVAAVALPLARGAALEAAVAEEASPDTPNEGAPASSRTSVFGREHDPRAAM